MTRPIGPDARRDAALKARETLLDRFADELDPDRSLPDDDRRDRALIAYRLHMSKLALKSGRVRRAARRSREAANDRAELSDAQQQCSHVWPATPSGQPVVDSLCMYCDLPYGQWTAPVTGGRP